MLNKPIVIGVGGFARAGKDTFVKVAKKIVEENGYVGHRIGFADALKNELSEFTAKYYNINIWTEDSKDKSLIRPLLIAHGCQKRVQTDGAYWVDKVDEMIENSTFLPNTVVFVSDCRFPNEVEWIHNKWGGWFVHLKKYTLEKSYVAHEDSEGITHSEIKKNRVYDEAPNQEEAKNDPICEKNADFRLELENVMERAKRQGIKINPETLADDTYLYNEIKLCLKNCPFLKIK